MPPAAVGDAVDGAHAAQQRVVERRRVAVEVLVDALRGTTTTSVPWLACEKTSENDLLIVSVRTYVPEIIATPSTTDIAVRIVRSGRARRPRRATFLMTTRPGARSPAVTAFMTSMTCSVSPAAPSWATRPSASTSRRSA